MELHLSKRLSALAQWVPCVARLADVGTDHAYLPVWLLQRGVIDRAIAADLRAGPLDHARHTGAEFGLLNRLDLRLGDGLAPVRPQEADTVVIAGMGGETIATILEAAPWTKTDTLLLLLQPQSTQNTLRRFLQREGYVILEEQVVREQGKFYSLMRVRGGAMPPLTPGEELAGRRADWKDQPERIEYMKFLHEKTARQVQGLRRSCKVEDAARLIYLEQALAEWENWDRETASDPAGR